MAKTCFKCVLDLLGIHSGENGNPRTRRFFLNCDNLQTRFRLIPKFVLECMDSRKYVFFSKNHKIRTLTAMDLLFCSKVPYLLVDS